jgi:hypothetical protein
VLVWPFIRGLTEQMTYNGYLAPRFQVLSQHQLGDRMVAFAWSLQHAFMPLTFDTTFMALRLLASVPDTVFQTMLYLRIRRLVPFAIAHAHGWCERAARRAASAVHDMKTSSRAQVDRAWPERS